MAKPNYAFEKRQRDLAKKKKKEEKEAEKRMRKATGVDGTDSPADADDPAAGGEGSPAAEPPSAG